MRSRTSISECEIREIKSDLSLYGEKEFFSKYFLRSANWYLNTKMGLSAEDQHDMLGRLKLIIVDSIPVSFNNIQIVGSSALGYSLAPHKPFCAFDDESDIDIALISNQLFTDIWKKLRCSYKTRYENTYTHIFRSIYRGYFNEKDILAIQGTRLMWMDLTQSSKKRIREETGITNEIAFRLYREWTDFEEYQLDSIKQLKRSL